MAFGYTFDTDDKLAWADKHNIAPGVEPYYRVDKVRSEIAKRLPKGHRRLAIVHDGISPVSCIVIGLNRTKEEIAKTKDQELLQVFRKVVGEEREPKWYELD